MPSTIHIADVVLYPTPAGDAEGIVDAILPSGEIQVIPVEEGLPFLVAPESLKVKSSFIADLISLKSDADLLSLLDKARELGAVVKEKKTGKTRAASTPKEQPKLEVEEL